LKSEKIMARRGFTVSSRTLLEVMEEEEDSSPGNNNSQLHNLARVGDVGGVRHLLKDLTKQDQWQIIQARNSTGSTALHVAAYYGQPELVELLLEAGANPWHKNRHGWHAGHYATRWSQPRNIRLSLGLRPGAPASASAAFSFSHIRERKKATMETAETRKARLQCDSGISVLGSEESLMGKKTEEVISLR